MRMKRRATTSNHFAPSLKVALVATLIVIVVYAAVLMLRSARTSGSSTVPSLLN